MPNCVKCKKRFRKDSGVRWLCFPRNLAKKSHLVAAIAFAKERDVTPSSRVCSEHFSEDACTDIAADKKREKAIHEY